jgi:hypothetical protein
MGRLNPIIIKIKMSYTQQDARIELGMLIDETLDNRDIEKAFELREIFAKAGDYEQAEAWDKQAKQWENEDWAYDNSINN